jgi:tryptophan synthase beta chain
LSGGLTTDNVTQAIRAVKPWAVDVVERRGIFQGHQGCREKSRRLFPEYAMQMYDLPDASGHFGPYGGVFVAETLIDALDGLKAAYARYQKRR